MLLEKLKENRKKKVVHFICHNSKSTLLTEKERIPNVIKQQNERGKKMNSQRTRYT